MLAPENRHLFNVTEYLQLFEKGILPSSVRTELVNGEIIELSPLGNPHAKTQLLILDFLRSVFKTSEVYVTGSIIVNEHCMPEPDVYVLKPGEIVEGKYPAAGQLQLAVEVGDSTIKGDLLNDGEGRLAIYAGAQVPAAWVIDISKKLLYEFSSPEGSIYKQCQVHVGETLLMGEKISVDNLVS